MAARIENKTVIVTAANGTTLTYRVGDEAVYDSYNKDYIGRIVSIGASTVTIQRYDGKKYRHDLARFELYNRVPIEKVKAANAAWSD